MSIEKFAELYRAAGIDVEITENEIKLSHLGAKFKASIDGAWLKSINRYFKSKQYTFNDQRRLLTSNKTIEIELVRIDPSFFARPEHEYTDSNGNSVKISTASDDFTFALMGSKIEPHPMEIIRRRLRRAKSRRCGSDGYITLHRLEELLTQPITAEYSVEKKIDSKLLTSQGTKAIKSCTFKLSLDHGECWEFREAMPARSSMPSKTDEPDTTIPKASYVDDLVKFYKVARSSVFPSQQFLSFYHVLEYNFLRVSDEILHTSIKTIINNTSFNSNYHNVNKLIATLKKYDNSSDETEMLKAVLKKYVDEDNLIEHIQSLESSHKKNTYTDPKKRIFGEQASIKLEKGHALQNTAKVIKQLRNALVHSSDKYNREDCFLPLSSSEVIIIEYIPILRFLAEQVIFATSEDK